MRCPSLETVAAWVLGESADDPGAAERFEEHYFVCDVCLGRAERLQRLIELLRASVPTVLTAERRRDLEALHPGLPAIQIEPGERATMRLGPSSELGIFLMRAPLAHATRVDLEATDAKGAALFALKDVPFDPARGEVALACQLHYRALPAPPELHVRLTVAEPGGPRPVVEYILDHEFETV